MQVAILSVRTGWHTDELCRALTERGHTGHVLSYQHGAMKPAASIYNAVERLSGYKGWNLLYIDDRLVSSVRFHYMTPEFRMAPSYSVFTDVLDPSRCRFATL